MQKDVIYIDTEDDITAIIGKVRASEHKIIALVPPKRIGAIQSAVNLKLVHRAAGQADKRLVMISNNAALAALAGSVGIPVAKNLQSKPELAEIPALEIDDGDDIIDGNEVTSPTGLDGEDAVANQGVDLTSAPNLSASPQKVALGATALAAQSKVKIPNFDRFRKRLLFIIIGVVLLAAFLVWAIVYAPVATITVTARTSDSSLNTQVKLGDALATSLQDGTVKSLTKTLKKDVSVPFDATGKKNIGETAVGTVTLDICGGISTPPSVAAGTTVVSGGNNYVTQEVASFSQSSPGYGCINYKSNAVDIKAAAPGTAYNVSGASFKVSGDSEMSASGSASGGTDKNITVVQQSDIDSVSDNIVNSSDSDAAQKSLAGQFDKGYVIIDKSFKTDTSAVKPSPAVGAEADSGKGTLTGPVTFSLTEVGS